jgi:hypothetical protein
LLKPRPAKVAIIGLLVLLLLSASDAFALTLPNPPDRSAPANNQTGPLPPPNARSFTGGVLLVKDSSSNQNASTNEFAAEFFCQGGTYDIKKQYKTEIGESISGPISNDQTAGIIQAISAVGPPKTVTLTARVGGVAFGISDIIFTLTGVTYNVTSYSIWVITQSSPAVEQRVGYFVTRVPVQLQIDRNQPQLPADCIARYGFTKIGVGFAPDALAWLYQPFVTTTAPPDVGVAPIMTYGPVRVFSGSNVAGTARIRAGENATFLLPPGIYSAVADVALFGIPFGVSSGTYSSPEGAAAAQFTVALASVEYIWYGLEAIALIIIVAVVLVIAKKIELWGLIIRSVRRVSLRLIRRDQEGR